MHIQYFSPISIMDSIDNVITSQMNSFTEPDSNSTHLNLCPELSFVNVQYQTDFSLG